MINRCFQLIGLIVVGIIILVTVSYTVSTVLKSTESELYNEIRDNLRVFRTKYFRPNQKYRFLEIHPEYLKVDVQSLLRVDSLEKVILSRKKLVCVVWKNCNFPNNITPTKVNSDIHHPVFSTMKFDSGINKNKLIVRKIDEFFYSSNEGFLSKSYHFKPFSSNGSLIIYHEGNTATFQKRVNTIKTLLEEGYEVLAYSMWIIDKQPIKYVKGSGNLKFIDHSFLKFLDEPLRVYFDPIVAGINKLLNENEYEKLIAIGFSGGGWVMTVYSALDKRIKLSYPIAASYPLYLRRFRNWSTWQETFPSLLSVANYLDLYVMATDGSGRRQLQVLNKYDGCCYSGMDWKTYADIVRNASKKMDGSGWDVFIDDTHADHKLSRHALNKIIDDINKN